MNTPNSALTVVIGTRVHSILHGGRNGIVYAIHGEQKAENCKVYSGVMHTGGRAKFDIVFNNGTLSRDLPECILRGVQWRIYDEVAPTDEIAEALEHQAATAADKAAKATEAKTAFEIECARLMTAPEYAHLINKTAQDRNQLAKNMRKDLKLHFPGVKFSVRMDGHNSCTVEWTDGPTTKAVEEVARKYKAGSYDGMQEIYEYNRTPFKEIFGDVQYLSIRRDYSLPTVQKALDNLKEKYSGNFSMMDSVPTAEDFLTGVSYRVEVPHLGTFTQLVRMELTELEG